LGWWATARTDMGKRLERTRLRATAATATFPAKGVLGGHSPLTMRASTSRSPADARMGAAGREPESVSPAGRTASAVAFAAGSVISGTAGGRTRNAGS
jgi:hypothetical protein